MNTRYCLFLLFIVGFVKTNHLRHSDLKNSTHDLKKLVSFPKIKFAVLTENSKISDESREGMAIGLRQSERQVIENLTLPLFNTQYITVSQNGEDKSGQRRLKNEDEKDNDESSTTENDGGKKPQGDVQNNTENESTNIDEAAKTEVKKENKTENPPTEGTESTNIDEAAKTEVKKENKTENPPTEGTESTNIDEAAKTEVKKENKSSEPKKEESKAKSEVIIKVGKESTIKEKINEKEVEFGSSLTISFCKGDCTDKKELTNMYSGYTCLTNGQHYTLTYTKVGEKSIYVKSDQEKIEFDGESYCFSLGTITYQRKDNYFIDLFLIQDPDRSINQQYINLVAFTNTSESANYVIELKSYKSNSLSEDSLDKKSLIEYKEDDKSKYTVNEGSHTLKCPKEKDSVNFKLTYDKKEYSLSKDDKLQLVIPKKDSKSLFVTCQELVIKDIEKNEKRAII